MTDRQRIIKTLRYMAVYGMLEQIYKDGLMTACEMLENDGKDIEELSKQLLNMTKELKTLKRVDIPPFE